VTPQPPRSAIACSRAAVCRIALLAALVLAWAAPAPAQTLNVANGTSTTINSAHSYTSVTDAGTLNVVTGGSIAVSTASTIGNGTQAAGLNITAGHIPRPMARSRC
jgi:hypothetical protein